MKNAPAIITNIVSITDMLKDHGDDDVELMKMDIDGPEIFVLRGIASNMSPEGSINAYGNLIKNIIVELTVGSWNYDHGIADNEVFEIFSKFYAVGYKLYLVGESEFKNYPVETLSKLIERRNVGFLNKCFEVPLDSLEEVLHMNKRVTKNFWLTLNPKWF